MDPLGESLIKAAADGDEQALQKCLAEGARVDYGDKNGETALMVASRAGHARIIRYLVERVRANVDLTFTDRGDGWTALMFAGYFGNLSIVRYLVEHGADPSLKNSDNLTVLDMMPCMSATLEDVQEHVELGIRARNDEKSNEVSLVQYGGPALLGGVGAGAGAGAGLGLIGADGKPLSVDPRKIAQKDLNEQGIGGTVASAGLKKPGKQQGARGSLEHDQEAARRLAQQQQQQQAFLSRGGGAQEGKDLSSAVGLRAKIESAYQSLCGEYGADTDPLVLAALRDLKTIGGLSELRLSCKNAKRKLTDTPCFLLFETFLHSFHDAPFHTIDLSYAGLSNASAKSIGAYLQVTSTLTQLNLEGNDIRGAAGGEYLAAGLARGGGAAGGVGLRSLNLSFNPIGDQGMCKIADALLHNRTLTDANFNDTDMGTLALIKLAQALDASKSSVPLARLCIDSPLFAGGNYNNGEETTIHLAKSLIATSSLKVLSLAKHKIRDHGARWIAEFLLKNVSLTEINLRCNKISTTGVAALAEALRYRRTPCFINLDGNELREKMLDEIDEVIHAAPPPPEEENGYQEQQQQPLCNVEYTTNEPIDREYEDHFMHQRHCLVSVARADIPAGEH